MSADDALSVSAAAAMEPTRPLLVTDEGPWTLGRVARGVAARRGWLAGHGLASGEPVGIEVAPTLEAVLWLLALIESGRPFVPVHPRLTGPERAAMLGDAGVRLTIAPALDPPDPPPSASPPAPIDPEAPLAIVYTSGTSGRPKGAVLSRRAFVASADASRGNLGRRDDDRWLLALPPAHVGGLAIVVRALVDRTAIVPWGSGPFDARRLVETTRRHRVTLLSLVPTMLHRLIEAGLALAPCVRAVLLGGAAAPPPLVRAAAARGIPVLATYGLTEACSQVATQPYAGRSPAGGAGRPLAGAEIRIRDGRILVRGPTLFSGYHPLGTSPSPFDADGFFDTGDDGMLDAEGFLHVLGRQSDLVVRGGENVHPAEVEAAAVALPGVTAACAFGVPDPEWGERVALVVVGADPAPLDLDAVVDALAQRLAPHKLPTLGAQVATLPTLGIGKVDRRGAAAAFASMLRPLARPRS